MDDHYCPLCGVHHCAVIETASTDGLAPAEELPPADDGGEEVAHHAIDALEHVTVEALGTIGEMQAEEEQTERVEAEAEALVEVVEAIAEAIAEAEPPAESVEEAPDTEGGAEAEEEEESSEHGEEDGPGEHGEEATPVGVPPQLRDPEDRKPTKRRREAPAFRARRGR